MTRVRIKFCGITSRGDAEAAVALGVDALGFVFYPPSPRCVSAADAARIIAGLPPFVSKVGLFVNATPEEVAETVAHTGIDTVQFHGDESPELCRAAPRPWYKAIRVDEQTDVAGAMAAYAGASAVLVDARDPHLYGGSGRTFDWSLLPAARQVPLILAGGLTVANVASAIRAVGPYAVDVSGGIERSKGVKDADKMKQFVREVTQLECHR